MYWILKDKKVIQMPREARNHWANWFERSDNRRVANTKIKGIEISTIFLGLDHNFAQPDGSDPILFETMIFGGKFNQYQERYRTWDEATKGHAKAVKKVQRHLERKIA